MYEKMIKIVNIQKVGLMKNIVFQNCIALQTL